MVHVKRGPDGRVVALSRDPAAIFGEEGWSEVAEHEPDVTAFCVALADEADPLRQSDLGFVRVLEDVIDLLLERAVIRFTDLPSAAQNKLMERRNVRAEMHKLSLLDDSDSLI